MKRLFTFLIIVCMLASALPMGVFAGANEQSTQTQATPQVQTKYAHPALNDDDIFSEYSDMIEPEETLTTNIPTKSPDRDVPGHYTFWSTHQYDQSIPFNQNDVDTMRRFFEIEVDGKTNGYRNNGTYYNKDDVLTWKGPWWGITEIDGVKTYVMTNIALAANFFNDGTPDKDLYDLRGDADFSGLEYVVSIYMNATGRYDRIKADNCAALVNFRISDNELYGELSYKNCPNLAGIYFDNVGLTELDLSEIPNAVILNCGYNKLSKLDLSLIPKLETLKCNNNNISELDFYYAPKIRELDCSFNPLYCLDLTDYTMWYVKCNDCNLHELYLPLHGEDILGVWCSNNYLTELDTLGIDNLNVLDCRSNYITELNFKDNTLLGALLCSENPIKELDTSMLLSLTTLSCENMGLEEIVFPKKTFSLAKLECSGNNLTSLDLRCMPSLSVLLCDNNQLTEIDLSYQTSWWYSTDDEEVMRGLEIFSCMGNPLKRIKNLPLLSPITKDIDVQNHFITLETSGAGFLGMYYTYTLNNGGNYVFDYHLHAKASPYSTEQFTGWYNGDRLITTNDEIDVDWTSPEKITAIFTGAIPTDYTHSTSYLAPHAEREMFVNSPDANLYDAHDAEKLRTFLEAEDGSGVKNGTKLNEKYSPNDISTWDFSCWKETDGKLSLRLLVMDTRIDRDGTIHESVPLAGKLDLSDCDELMFVICPDGNIKEADFTGCKKLVGVSLYGNTELSEVLFMDCDNLRNVKLHDCALTQFNLSDNMCYVNLRNNKLTQMSVGNPKHLSKLDVSYNELSELTFSEERNVIRILICSYNKLTVLKVDYCANVWFLDCSHNSLTKLVTFGEKYRCDPYVVDCSYNELTDIGIWGSNTWVLHADNNKIKRDILGDMPNLMELSVSNNEIAKINLSNSPYLCALDCSHCKCKEINFGFENQIVVLHCNDNELESLKIPEGVYINRLGDLDCSNNRLTEIDLINAGTNMYSLKLSGNPLTKIKNAPVRHGLYVPLVTENQPIIRINIQVQGAGTLDYDLDTITAIGEDFTGFYSDGTKLTESTTLPTDDLESCTITAMFGKMQLGDANMDGTVNTGDAVVVLKHSAEMIQLTSEQKALADTNRDGNVNTGDAVMILKYAAGIISTF